MKFECNSGENDIVEARETMEGDVAIWAVSECSGTITVYLSPDSARALAKHILSLLPPVTVASDCGVWHKWADEQPDKTQRVVYSDCNYDLILEWRAAGWTDVEDGVAVDFTNADAVWHSLPKAPS